MLEFVASIFRVFIPESIEDQNSSITYLKLSAGLAFAFCIIAGAFLILSGFLTMTTETFGSVSMSNATIMICLGSLIAWLTLTKIGVRRN
ncbi:MAG: hypothetical protein IGQ45_04245 [Cyanobacterium sp. T60_A2020_053]|nr:hypothetical protein [Cyanobacterium sp. T60_A2020_053]